MKYLFNKIKSLFSRKESIDSDSKMTDVKHKVHGSCGKCLKEVTMDLAAIVFIERKAYLRCKECARTSGSEIITVESIKQEFRKIDD